MKNENSIPEVKVIPPDQNILVIAQDIINQNKHILEMNAQALSNLLGVVVVVGTAGDEPTPDKGKDIQDGDVFIQKGTGKEYVWLIGKRGARLVPIEDPEVHGRTD